MIRLLLTESQARALLTASRMVFDNENVDRPALEAAEVAIDTALDVASEGDEKTWLNR